MEQDGRFYGCGGTTTTSLVCIGGTGWNFQRPEVQASTLMCPKTLLSPSGTKETIVPKQKFLPKVYLHKMSSRIEANHRLDNICINERLSMVTTGTSGQEVSKTVRRKSLWSPIVMIPQRGQPTNSEENKKPMWEKDFKTMKKEILLFLGQILAKSKLYSIHDVKGCNNTPKRDFELPLPSSDVLKKARSVNLVNIQYQDFARLCSDRSLSLSFQSLIIESQPHEIYPLLQKVQRNFAYLVGDEYGSYVAQHAIRCCQAVASAAGIYCSSRLYKLSQDQFAARSLYALARTSESFRVNVFTWFALNAYELHGNLHSVVLVSVAIRSVESLLELATFGRLLDHPEIGSWAENKEFLRVMVTFVERCDRGNLDKATRVLKISKRLINLLHEKHGAMLIVRLAEREHKTTERAILKEMRSNLAALIKAKYFKYFFFKVVLGQCNWTLIREMQSSLLSLQRDIFEEALDSREAEYFYCSILASMCEPGSKLLLKTLVKSVWWPDSLRETLIGLQGCFSTARNIN